MQKQTEKQQERARPLATLEISRLEGVQGGGRSASSSDAPGPLKAL